MDINSTSASARPRFRVGLPGATLPPWIYRHGQDGYGATDTAGYYAGFLFDFYNELARLGDFEIAYIAITDPAYLSDFGGVAKRLLGENAIDLTWDPAQSQTPGFVYTQPMFWSGDRVLTRKSKADTGIMQVFAPFDSLLWAGIVVGVLFSTLVMVVLSGVHTGVSFSCGGRRKTRETAVAVGGSVVGAVQTQQPPAGDPPAPGSPDEEVEQGETSRSLLVKVLTFFYHTVAALLGGDEYDLYHVPVYGRVHRVGLLFFVMVVSATYTANLAAFLTKQSVTIHGPQTAVALQSAKVCFRWDQYNSPDMLVYVGSMVLPPAAMEQEKRGAWGREKLEKGECDAIVEPLPFAQKEALQFCGSMHLNPDLQFGHRPVVSLMRDDTQAHLREWFSSAEQLRGRRLSPEQRQRKTLGALLGGGAKQGSEVDERHSGGVLAETAAAGSPHPPQRSRGLSAEAAYVPLYPNHPGIEVPGVAETFVNNAILSVLSSPAYPEMIKRNMRLGQSCEKAESSDTAPVKLEHMGIAFLVLGACSGVAILCTLGERRRRAVKGEQMPSDKGEVQNEKLDSKLDLVLAQLAKMSAAGDQGRNGNT
mmetsp:Transcript_19031/g.47638  ORF Transcript_19031/g.47638 Transcript_19031/m.47638 type:complete len:591 (+) Transcript_19031:147-1919(+)|eukprot:CAMPEP_0178988936 /NCGR_PEP_ID=MMETSP0795-20121207/4075_1 /TAXON_ID=88552 /ORGANISM="Amoebophrya sp., Strain Ameob2" /LENGTH=590 /DNA_ID=CAMNT_0020680241 /DNA_START=132 /DNA_END=1904 /DNA_ORIENTATION=+